ncbi:MAG TPA: glycosyltransferase [candidate division Zixibacteria bacterium]|nr:glycosyltransferase [candidate division Zixibacteria bacterium]
MAGKKILYISGSLGLGHIYRDLAITSELRKAHPNLEVLWLAAHPATVALEEAGERLFLEAGAYANDNISAEEVGEEGFHLNLLSYLMNAQSEWKANVKVFNKALKLDNFDIVIADEAYEIAVGIGADDIQLELPFIFIYDFIGNVSMSWNPIEQLVTYMWNREWTKLESLFAEEKNHGLFIGLPEDIPNTSLGFLLPNRRKLGEAMCEFIGYILPFDPEQFKDQKAIKKRLGYGEETLVICSIGGTSVGKELLELCAKTYPILRKTIPDLKMVLVCGPRLPVETLEVPEGIEVHGYLPDLYMHFAASDLTIAQGGGTTTLELTALQRPFIYFPLEGHFEQQVHVAGRLGRHGAGIKLLYSETTPPSLAEMVLANLNKDVSEISIPVDGAKKAAEIISPYLTAKQHLTAAH